MQAGKLASQCGHAFVGALLSAQARPEGQAYAKLHIGTKVALQGTLAQLGRAVESLKEAGLTYRVVVDSGCPNFFGGEPTITALGFGPVTKSKVPKFIRKLGLY